jgi:Protein of unknown function (DUF3047)
LRRLRLTGCLVALALVGPVSTSQLAVIVFNPAGWPTGRIPPDWHLKINHGRSDVEPCAEGNNYCLRLKSIDSSFALERAADVDPYDNRYLTWRWKVTQLPLGGDFRHTTTDDQAAQLLVAFGDRHVLSYIWDSAAPKGATEAVNSNPFVHIYVIVCESGASQLGNWVPEIRDVAADYERAFAKPAPHIKGLRLQINSQHTGTTAESYFGEVALRSKP